MMNFLAQAGIGDRIQAIRKQHAIRSARALADLIPGDNVTESIVQNIEAGGKDDLLVSQLLNIAKALRVSPIFLLAPHRHTLSPVRHRQPQLALR
ncbi:helix-turn-helix domain-containing protein [Cryobacterium serini]|uniref:XRE family transcriptional regulator n=1 Tax=Cryobacterium serini TaxID=1259201 RepID=A0A4R9BTZ0_9MICO|nr:helix-turn-helix domain-containing protein [Cryobacterium serini]TFD89813.1 XRE family transcriptional regulator [Cryobacterium serini]